MSHYRADDRSSKKGELGVIKVALILYHLHREKLMQDGCVDYRLCSVEKISEQRRGVDLFEEWTDAKGVRHRKAHEVKTEEHTLAGEWGSREDLTEVYAPYTGASAKDGFKPTGWFSLEFIQDIPLDVEKHFEAQLEGMKTYDKLPDELNQYKGWYFKMRDGDNESHIQSFYPDGRDLWQVACMHPVENGEEWVDRDLNSIAFHMPEDLLHALLMFDRYGKMETHRTAPVKKMIDGKQVEVVSWVFKMPLENIESLLQKNDGILMARITDAGGELEMRICFPFREWPVMEIVKAWEEMKAAGEKEKDAILTDLKKRMNISEDIDLDPLKERGALSILDVLEVMRVLERYGEADEDLKPIR